MNGETVIFLTHNSLALRITPNITVIFLLHKDWESNSQYLGNLIALLDNVVNVPAI